MSHFTKVKTKIKDLIKLKEALKELNMEYVEASEGIPLKIKGWEKTQQQVDMEIKTGCSYSVGVLVKEDSLEFVSDWWGLETYTGIKQEEFLNKITQKYAYCTVLDKIKEKGYDLVTEEVDDKQTIRLVVRKWE